MEVRDRGALSIRIDPIDVERIKSDLRHVKNGLPISVRRSINRAVDGIRTDMVTIARREYNVKAKAVRKNITVKKASYDSLSAYTVSSGTPIQLVNFDPRPSTPQPRRKAPITVEVIRGERKPVEHAFVAVMPSGHKGVFRRAKKNDKRVGRLPIEELEGPRIEDLYAKPPIMFEIQTKAEKRMAAELERQADYLFRQRMGIL